MKTIAQLINPGTSLINIKDYNCIGVFNKEELSNLKEVSIWIINLNLNWDNNHLQNNYGLDMGVYIRKELKSKAPILFLSPIYEEVLLTNYANEKRKTDFKYNLLYKWQTYITNYPYSENISNLINSNKLENISENVLNQTINSIFNYRAMIEKHIHDFKNDRENFSKYNDYLIQLISKDYNDKYLVAFNNLITNINHSTIEIFKNTILPFAIQSKTEEVVLVKEKEKKGVLWEILYLDDQQHFLDYFSKLFEENGIKCNIAKTEEEAIKILDENENIEVFISDLMIYGNYEKEMRPGIEVIQKYIKKKIACYILTSNKSAIIESKYEFVRIKWKEKNSLNFKDFINEIKCDVILNLSSKNKYDMSRSFYDSNSKKIYSYYDMYSNIKFSDEIEKGICEFVKNNINVSVNFPKGGTEFKLKTLSLNSNKFIEQVLYFRRLFLHKLMTLNESDFNIFIENSTNINNKNKKEIVNKHLMLSYKYQLLKRECYENILGFGKYKIFEEEINYLKDLHIDYNNKDESIKTLEKISAFFKSYNDIITLYSEIDNKYYNDLSMFCEKSKNVKINEIYYKLENILSENLITDDVFYYNYLIHYFYLINEIASENESFVKNNLTENYTFLTDRIFK
jgi:CheY-like chemotaxis protein